MSESTFLEKLLEGAEVEWVPLGDEQFSEIANRRPGSTVKDSSLAHSRRYACIMAAR